jgi:hypothetical protein
VLQKQANFIGTRYEDPWKEIIEKVEIWKDDKNTKLPGPIQDGSSLLYFHPEVYIKHFKKYDNGHAEDLIKVQDAVLSLRCLRQGNWGIYPEVYNYNPNGAPPRQTYCNHAAFLTVLATDQNAANFTGKTNNTDNGTTRVGSAFPEPSPRSDPVYTFKNSNYWCDRLCIQAGEGKIVELSAEEAQEAANMGYTVVAAWKAVESRGSPHYATVRPGYGYDDRFGPMVANVGTYTGFFRAKDYKAFGSSAEIRWYYNPAQTFRCYLNLINGYKDRIV